MCFQFGFFARLTWWEYSWDIMEPVTYFAGYFNAMVAYAYYLITRQVSTCFTPKLGSNKAHFVVFQEYILPDVKDRSFLLSFYKKSKKTEFDVAKYNELKDKIAQIEIDLKRLRDPLALHLPILPPKNPDEQMSTPQLQTRLFAKSIRASTIELNDFVL